MAASREKQRAHRKKTLEAIKSSVKLHEPISTESHVAREKIKVPAKAVKTRTALIQGQGRSMDMEID
jgi:large subunit ribosomal protein L24e